MKYIPKQLANEIKERYNFLEQFEESERKTKSRKIKKRVVEKNAQIHSYRLENPKSGVPFSVPRNKDKRSIKNGIKNIEDAFRWGKKNFDPETFKESFIREIARRIMPELYAGIGMYRDMGTRITGSRVTPPYPYKLINYEIPEFVESMNRQLTCQNIINRIETAIYAHFHVARMHPFIDGNGRASRTLQNVILDYFDIPLPVIEAGERITYYQILDKAVYDWTHKKSTGEIKHGATEGEQLFYNFIAGKINNSLDKIISSCNNFH